MPGDSDDGTTIRAATLSDAGAVAEIYNYYIAETVSTFEEEPVTDAEIARRLELVWSASFPWLVAEEGGQVIGYAYASRWNSRSAYRFTAEATVYLAPGRGGRGLGSKLYAELFRILQGQGIHTVIGVVSLPNNASVALQEKFGLRKVGHFAEVGFKFDRWIEVGYWQRTFPASAERAPEGAGESGGS